MTARFVEFFCEDGRYRSINLALVRFVEPVHGREKTNLRYGSGGSADLLIVDESYAAVLQKIAAAGIEVL
jgi:hypothetical protein